MVKKKKVRGENMGHLQTQQCVGERLDRETKKTGETTKQEARIQGTHSDRWQEVGTDSGMKKARDGCWRGLHHYMQIFVQKALKEV